MFIKRNESQISQYGELTILEVMDVVAMDDAMKATELQTTYSGHETTEELILSTIKQKQYAQELIENGEFDSVIDELDQSLGAFSWEFDDSQSPLELTHSGNRINFKPVNTLSNQCLINFSSKFQASLYDDWGKIVETMIVKKKKSFFSFLGLD